ncbi:hypothetical protein M8C21_023911 [Ambrosia artemisiifolia]|uniref:MLO-like protein n=1 Tax=Ambrosia artemisiifolia TaxID=4212 RepID=A0AAD5GTA9_AMBAR|nr:hypothetical protein M8C21_023911 [Ambrosia artemisiifolia]
MTSEDVKEESRSLALTPTWSVATVLTIFVVVSLLVERSIHRLSNWLKKTNRKPLLAAVEKMKEELMLLGFISLLLTATSSIISDICIPSKYYDSAFAPCTRSEVDEEMEEHNKRKLYMNFSYPHRRVLNVLNQNTCQKIHSWRKWEDEAQVDRHDVLTEISRNKTMRRQSTIAKFHSSNSFVVNGVFSWMVCFFRQFGRSVVRADYLTLRKAFILNHNLTSKYDFHSYMIRSMEEEFQRIVGVSGPLWGFVVAFMLFNVKGSNLYFWIAIIPITLVLLVGTKLQHVIATLALESAGITGMHLSWLHSFGSGGNSATILVLSRTICSCICGYFWGRHISPFSFTGRIRLGWFLCSYSTLPLYALVTQMGTNYKAALIPQRIRDTIHGWGKEARRRRRRLGIYGDDSTVHTDTSTVVSVEEYDNHELDSPRAGLAPSPGLEIELQSHSVLMTDGSDSPFVANENSSRVGTPLLKPCASVSAAASPSFVPVTLTRSSSLPAQPE